MVNLAPVSLLNSAFNYPGYLGKSGKQRLLSFLDVAKNKNPAEVAQYFATLFDSDEQNTLLTKDLVNLSSQQCWETLTSGSALQEVLSSQYHDWLPDSILMRQDKMSMAHSLEARVPFLDHKLIEFMQTVPDHLKLNLKQNKILLRRYAEKNKLFQLAQRKKSAFYFPMENYFNSKNFQEILASTLSEAQIKQRGFFNYKAINQLIRRMHSGDFLASKQVFSLVSLELWQQIFLDKKYNFYPSPRTQDHEQLIEV